MGVEQIIVLVLFGLELMLGAYMHGKPRKEHNVFGTIVGIGIIMWLLVSGGFFS
jgi:hypothetical protein